MNPGTVVFSLDFELGWGHKGTRPAYVKELESESGQLRERVISLIELFDRYSVQATWATVGQLVKSGGDQLFHAPGLFEKVLNAETAHEIALHSYKHVTYDQLSKKAAREDLANGVDALLEWGIKPSTFVFPQNKISHVKLLSDHDFVAYRSQPESSRLSLISGLLSPRTHSPKVEGPPPIEIPTSLFIGARRPTRFRQWQARRVLDRATSRGELVHYWFHPHNVVTNPELLNEIEKLLRMVSSAEKIGSLKVRSMAGFAKDHM